MRGEPIQLSHQALLLPTDAVKEVLNILGASSCLSLGVLALQQTINVLKSDTIVGEK